VTEYVAMGLPVGSRTLARRYGLELSPASIRNVLKDLEEAGYITQPHTSAGRIPTDRGFRVFVDALVELEQVSAADRRSIADRLERSVALAQRDQFNGIHRGEEVMREAGRVLADLTGAATVVTGPAPEEEPLEELRFMPLRDGELLAILVAKTGAVQNRVLRQVPKLGRDDLERVNNYLDSLLEGGSLRELRNRLASDMDRERGTYHQLATRAGVMLEAAVAGGSGGALVLIEGQGRLFDRPEFTDVSKLREYLRAFEEKERLLELLEQTLAADGVRVLIGAEAGMDPLKDISVISSTYRRAAGTSGTLAVVGPTRMDYAKVVPLVQFTAQAVSRTLAQGEGARARDPDPREGADGDRGPGI
jgi:heat-inducible transcriptional repressor